MRERAFFDFMMVSISKNNSSLKGRLDEILDDAYYIAKLKSERETSLPEDTLS